MISEWFALRSMLVIDDLKKGQFKNQFYKQLVNTLTDVNSGFTDCLLSYRDALLSCPKTERAILPFTYPINDNDKTLLESIGLEVNVNLQEIKLNEECFLEANDGVIDFSDVYDLKKKRFVKNYPIDPSLSNLLNDDRYINYNGNAQQTSIRIALTSEKNSTLIVNLPTGMGKTLIAHALTGFSNNNKFTLVIVPTIGLAIDQGERVIEALEKMNLNTSGYYNWYGGQDKKIQDQIKKNIKNGTQQILFCSPESACRSLLPTLYHCAENDYLENVIVDEAHLVDQWGADFRPYFQIFSAVFHSLRKISKTGIRCVLMSATFSEKTLNVLKKLFETDSGQLIEIVGNSLRPEIQYSVKKVNEESHFTEVIQATLRLPKPLIVYTVTVIDAKRIFSRLTTLGISRVDMFTGETSSASREEILKRWTESKLDIIIATSAFGVGMDKSDVRSVLHASIPENIDRFYQEVGRSGRDGIASQSFLIYHENQYDVSEKINNQTLISHDLGLKRWKKMWETGIANDSGNRVVNVQTIHDDLSRQTDENEKWNWRTLLLMKRSGLIDIQFTPPNPPSWDDNLDDFDNKLIISKYFDEYYKKIRVIPLNDRHMTSNAWVINVDTQRKYEIDNQRMGFKKLEDWLKNQDIKPLCLELKKYYTFNNYQPEYVCGGCPGCRSQGRVSNKPSSIGYSCHVIGINNPSKWQHPISLNNLHQFVYYDESKYKTNRSIIRDWINWISPLIETGSIKAIRSDPETLALINKRISSGTNNFWIGIQNNDYDYLDFWPELILLMPEAKDIPDMGFEVTPKILVAPKNIKHSIHNNSFWWERDNTSLSLTNFLSGLNYVNH